MCNICVYSNIILFYKYNTYIKVLKKGLCSYKLFLETRTFPNKYRSLFLKFQPNGMLVSLFSVNKSVGNWLGLTLSALIDFGSSVLVMDSG